MSGLELNKIIASILLASIIAMLVGFLVNAVYKPNLHPGQRGFAVHVQGGSDAAAPVAAEPEEHYDVAALMKTANAEAGKGQINKCLSCHSIDKGGPNKVGPNLWGVVGRVKGSHEGYKYSPAMIAKGGNWAEEDLFHMLHKPGAFIPGTKMTFAGFKKTQDIADMVAYLKTLAD